MIHAAQKRKEFNTLFIVTIRKSSHFLPDNLCLGKYKEIQYYSQCIEHQSAHNGMCYMIGTDTIEIDNGTDDGNTQCIGKDNVKNANYTYNDTFKNVVCLKKDKQCQICHDLQNTGTFKVDLERDGSVGGIDK